MWLRKEVFWMCQERWKLQIINHFNREKLKWRWYIKTRAWWNVDLLMCVERSKDHRVASSLFQINQSTQCLRIAQKVAFKVASKASYVYILSGQKLVHFGEFLSGFDKFSFSKKKLEKQSIWWVFEKQKLVVKQCCQTCQL